MTTVNSPFTRQVLAALHSGTHFTVMPFPLQGYAVARYSVMPSLIGQSRYHPRAEGLLGENVIFLSFSKARVAGVDWSIFRRRQQ
jgi:hypothetical protein